MRELLPAVPDHAAVVFWVGYRGGYRNCTHTRARARAVYVIYVTVHGVLNAHTHARARNTSNSKINIEYYVKPTV